MKPLRELLDLRTKLSDLRGSLQGNDKLEEMLMDAVSNTEKLEKLKGEVGREAAAMSDAQKARSGRSGSNDRNSVCSTRSSSRAGLARDPPSRERGKDLVKSSSARCSKAR